MADKRVLLTSEEREAREARLPQWAQRELSVLRRQLAEAQGIAKVLSEEASAVASASDTVAEVAYGKEVGLGKGSRVNFYVEEANARGFRRYITIRVDGSWIDINGYDALAIHPGASNNVRIGLRR